MQYSIIQKSQLEEALRLDAEYYQPEYFIDFTKGKWQPIGDFLKICQYGLSQAMNDEKRGYPMFKMDDINHAFLFSDEVRYADILERTLSNFVLEKNDVLFNRVNSEEFVGITGILKLDLKSTFASYLIRLKVKNDSEIMPDYLNIFLNSKYGLKQIKKFSRRAVNQANVNAEELKQIKIAVLPFSAQKEIEKLSNESWKNFKLSKVLYLQAEDLLLEELGLKDFEPEDDLSYVVNLVDVKFADRIDAEHFQPRLEAIFNNIKVPVQKLEQLVKFLNHAKQPPYIDIGDREILIITQRHLGQTFLNSEALNNQETKFTSKDWLKMYPAYKLKQGDVLYYSVGAYIGKTNIILDNLDATAASFITIIRPKEEIDPIYLTVVLNSIIGELQSEKWQSATAQQYIYPKDIQNFKIPILPKSTQQKIADLVRQSHVARKKAKQFLEQAKQRVEDLIENKK